MKKTALKRIISGSLATFLAALTVTTNAYAEETQTLPEKYDLRDYGYVTPVKNQDPWGTCWSFSAIASVETSILSELGYTFEEYPLDLSERHLAWFSLNPIPQDSGHSQAGEGVYNMSGHQMTGATQYLATSLYGTNTGPLLEQTVPYNGIDENGNPSRSPSADWSVDEELRSYYNYVLQNSNVLPSTVTFDQDGNYVLDTKALENLKAELMAGRGISVSFFADTYLPDQAEKAAQYINTDTWAHFTYESVGVNHGVTIVGWDDNYPKENFLSETVDDEGNPVSVPQPEGDGAWIVKNSWGCTDYDKDDPNYRNWGYEGSGYFYLSYYDRTITNLETFDFDIESTDTATGILAYDYLPSFSVKNSMGFNDGSDIRYANIFNPEEDVDLFEVSFETNNLNTVTDVSIYLLDKEYENPEDGELICERSYTFDYPGFHRVSLGEEYFIPEGKLVSIVIHQHTDVLTAVLPIKLIENQAYYEVAVANGIDMPLYGKAIVNEGESFVMYDNAWHDWATEDEGEGMLVAILGALIDYRDCDNHSIKAYVRKPEQEPTPGESTDIPEDDEPGTEPEPGESTDIPEDDEPGDTTAPDENPDIDGTNPPTGVKTSGAISVVLSFGIAAAALIRKRK